MQQQQQQQRYNNNNSTTSNETSPATACVRCKEVIKGSDAMVRLRCGHEYHFECGVEFFTFTHSCMKCANLQTSVPWQNVAAQNSPINFGDGDRVQAILHQAAVFSGRVPVTGLHAVQATTSTTTLPPNEAFCAETRAKLLKQRLKQFRSVNKIAGSENWLIEDLQQAEVSLETLKDRGFCLSDVITVFAGCTFEHLVAIGLTLQHLTDAKFTPNVECIAKLLQTPMKLALLVEHSDERFSADLLINAYGFSLTTLFQLGFTVETLITLGMDGDMFLRGHDFVGASRKDTLAMLESGRFSGKFGRALFGAPFKAICDDKQQHDMSSKILDALIELKLQWNTTSTAIVNDRADDDVVETFSFEEQKPSD